MNGRLGRAWLVWLALGLFSAVAPDPVAAQAPVEDPASRARFQWGPVFLTPTLVIKEIGVDSNVFNETTAPREDFTATLSPQLLVGLRLGPVRLSATSVTDYVWYRDLVEERSVNTGTEARFDLILRRLRPFVRARFVDTRERPTLEIDARARRREPAYGAGVDMRFGGRTAVVAAVERQVVDFAADQTFRGVDLARALNRETRAASVALRVALTPLTTISVSSGVDEARFDAASVRDAESIRLLGGVEFQPEALLNGSAQVGIRRFTPREPFVPDFQGVVATVTLGSTLLGVTRFGATLQRDVAYSFEDETPYYLLSGVGGSVTQRLGGPVDLTVGVTRRYLSYRALEGSSAFGGGSRRDIVDVATAGVGIDLGAVARLGVNAEYTERRSNSPRGRPFERLKLFVSLSYLLGTR